MKDADQKARDSLQEMYDISVDTLGQETNVVQESRSIEDLVNLEVARELLPRAGSEEVVEEQVEEPEAFDRSKLVEDTLAKLKPKNYTDKDVQKARESLSENTSKMLNTLLESM